MRYFPRFLVAIGLVVSGCSNEAPKFPDDEGSSSTTQEGEQDRFVDDGLSDSPTEGDDQSGNPPSPEPAPIPEASCTLAIETFDNGFLGDGAELPYNESFRFLVSSEDFEIGAEGVEIGWRWETTPDISAAQIWQGNEADRGYPVFSGNRVGADAVGDYVAKATVIEGDRQAACTVSYRVQAPPGLLFEVLWDGPGWADLHVTQRVWNLEGTERVWCINGVLGDEADCETQDCVDRVRARNEATRGTDCGLTSYDCHDLTCRESCYGGECTPACADWDRDDACTGHDPAMVFVTDSGFGPESVWIEDPLVGTNVLVGIHHYPIPPFPGQPVDPPIGYTLRLWLDDELLAEETDSVEWAWFSDAMIVEVESAGLLGGRRLSYQTLKTGEWGTVALD